jgi:hypothetical protein
MYASSSRSPFILPRGNSPRPNLAPLSLLESRLIFFLSSTPSQWRKTRLNPRNRARTRSPARPSAMSSLANIPSTFTSEYVRHLETLPRDSRERWKNPRNAPKRDGKQISFMKSTRMALLFPTYSPNTERVFWTED